MAYWSKSRDAVGDREAPVAAGEQLQGVGDVVAGPRLADRHRERADALDGQRRLDGQLAGLGVRRAAARVEQVEVQLVGADAGGVECRLQLDEAIRVVVENGPAVADDGGA